MMKQRILLLSVAALFVLTGSPIFAFNGMNLPAYGARSAGMGGAVTAIGGSVMDLETNPSHLAGLEQTIVEGGVNLAFPSLTYRDSFLDEDPDYYYTNKVDAEPAVFPLPYMGIAGPLGENMGWGLAFYAQGGAGAEFNGIRRHFPGRANMQQLLVSQLDDPNAEVPYIGDSTLMTENTYSYFAFARLTPGLAIEIGDVKLGAGLDFGVTYLEWRWTFSDPTGTMEMPGAGYRYKSDPAYSLSGKVGITYEPVEGFTMAYTYKARAKSYVDGDISINAGNPTYYRSLDTSTYLEWPESHSVGFAYSSEEFTIGLDFRYVKWSNVMNSMDFNLPEAWVETPLGNQISVLPFSVKWKDQRIVAIGAEYKPGMVSIRGGYNYGNNPVSDQGINPMFAAITEHHFSLGLGLDFGDLDIDFAVEYEPQKTVHGSDMSDWDIYHAIAGDPEMIESYRMPYYNHSITMESYSIIAGVKYAI